MKKLAFTIFLYIIPHVTQNVPLHIKWIIMAFGPKKKHSKQKSKQKVTRV